MKHPILLLFMILPLLVLVGCNFITYDGGSNSKENPQAVSACNVRLDLIGLTYYWCSGSLAGTNRTYCISKDSAGACLFHAEIEPDGLIVDDEITREEFDSIIQMVSDNYLAKANDESEYAGEKYALPDADSSNLEVTFEDGQTQLIDLKPADNRVLSELTLLLENTSAK